MPLDRTLITRDEQRGAVAPIDFVRAEDDDDSRMWISISSEEPYSRWDGVEILSHDKSAIRLDWLKSGNAPLLLDHDKTQQIGIIEDAVIEKGRVRALVRFSKSSPLAVETLAGVKEGIKRNVSVGYRIHEYTMAEDKESYTVTDWTPQEASIVAVPADTTVGTNRSTEKENIMTEPIVVAPTGPTEAEIRAQIDAAVQTAANAAEVKYKERLEIMRLGQARNMADKANEAIAAGVSLSEFRGIVLAALPTGTPLESRLTGISDKETQRFSIMKLARVLADNSGSARSEAAFEIEACDAAAKANADLKTNGFRIPEEVMQSFVRESTNTRAVISTTGASAFQFVENRPESFIDYLVNEASVMRAGATMLRGLTGNIDIPGGNANAAGAWLATEGANAAETVPTFRKVTLSPKDVAGYTDIGRRTMQQSSADVEALVRRLLMEAMARAIDLGALAGTGASGQPTGIKSTAGIGNPTDFVALNNPTYAESVALETVVANANALQGNLAYICGTAMRGNMKTRLKDAGSGLFLLGDNGLVNGYPLIASNQAVSGDLYFGNWSEVMIGMWGGLDLDVDKAAGFLAGATRLRAIQTIDVGVRNAVSFALNNGGV